MFRQLHEMNAAVHTARPETLRRIDEQIEQARRAAAQNAVLQWREYFFALHALTSLQTLIEAVRAA